MKHFKILVWFDSPQVKWYMKSSKKNIVLKLPHNLPNDLRRFFRKFGNYGKNQKMCGGRAKYPVFIPKEKIGTSGQKLYKDRYQSFSSCPVLLDFLLLFH